MLFRIPLLVTESKSRYTAKPLFHPAPERIDDNLGRLLGKLTRDFIRMVEDRARSDRQDIVALWTFAPPATLHRIEVEIELRRRRVKMRLLVARIDYLGRRFAFCTSVPDAWFELFRGEQLQARAQDVLQDHWRRQERDAESDDEVKPELSQIAGKAWIQTLEFTARTRLPVAKSDKNPYLFLGGDRTPDGAFELLRVGRCLDWLYPDDLDRALLREREATELGRLLASSDLRPVLLVGPRQSGKTAIIHECIHRLHAEPRQENSRKPGQTWLVSPQRLISGMSHVGQWEGRLLAIIKHVRKRHHTLYFDDLPGLFHAGVTNQSPLSAAMVLKPYLEDRRIRVLAEITPGELRALRERDRGFADLFHILPVGEMSDEATARVLVSVQRRLEARHKAIFALDVLPAVIDLQRRYEKTAAFPGKAVSVLARLAVRAARETETTKSTPEDPFAERPLIQRAEVLQDAVAQTGLALAFLDPSRRLDREQIHRELSSRVIGQAEAVDALVDVVGIAKARLNDPDRPLASFLFLGPTGVGKTETAKAAAATLFGNADRLVRFDLNEFNQHGSAARLVGTIEEPEGLLTAAIRRQPFCVLLLDEIEKAHPDVHDVLLQVIGEGRLTDASGRSADFTNAIILMTSNLGVREAGGGVGLRPSTDDSGAYARAAERFFRPEFFNRLDRIIPFHRLERSDMERIARRLVGAVLAREGFAQRECAMVVSPEALESIVQEGYDPDLGARAMKRAVERQLTRPAAARLAGIATDQLTVVSIRAEQGRLSLDVDSPGWATVLDRDLDDGLIDRRLDRCREGFEGLNDRIAELRPARTVVAGKVTPEQERYFALKELATEIAGRMNALDARSEGERHARFESASHPRVVRKPRYRAAKHLHLRSMLLGLNTQPNKSLLSALSLEEAIDEIGREAEPIPLEAELFDLENQLALLKLMADAPIEDKPVFLRLHGFPHTPKELVESVAKCYRDAWGEGVGLEIAERAATGTDRILELKGFHARSLAKNEVGTHVILPKHGGPLPMRIAVTDSLDASLPESFAPILRVYPEGKPIVDIRTGLVAAPPYAGDLFRTFTLAALERA